MCASAVFFDPGGTDGTRPLRCAGAAPVRLKTKARRGWCSRGSMARLGHWLSVLHQSRPFSEEMPDLSAHTANGRHPLVRHAPNGCLKRPCLRLRPPARCLRSRASASDPGLRRGTARVAPICCLGRIVPSTTAELAASEIAPSGLVWPLDTTLDALEQAPRQLAKGGPTDRCLRGESDSYPPFAWAPSPPVGPASLVAGAPAGKAPDT